jgi:O-antigen/teichoic acid export membrane protein
MENLPSNPSKENPTQGKAIKKGFFFIVLSNLVSLLVGIGSSFLIPKLLQVDDYAIFKLFTLYSSYVGFFHFGFVDGIYLRFGGENYSNLNKEKFRSYFRFFLLLELSASLITCSLAFIKGINTYVLFLVAFELLLSNLITYFSAIAQITTRFKMVSAGSFLLSITKLINLFIFLKLTKIADGAYATPYAYIFLCLTSELFELSFFFYKFKDLVLGKGENWRSIKKDIASFFSLGMPLLLSNLITILLFNSNTQIVSLGFDSKTFGVYSFSYNVFSVVSIFTSAISLVLFPVLKRFDTKVMMEKYSVYLEKLSILLCFSLCFFPPIKLFINWFLPNYAASIDTIRICLPAIILYNLLLILVHNYYKASNKTPLYTLILGLVAILGVGIEVLVFYLTKSTNAISFAYFGAYYLAFVVLDLFVSIKIVHHVDFKAIGFLTFSFAAYFVMTHFVENIWICFFCLVFVFLALMFLFFPKTAFSFCMVCFRKITPFFENIDRFFKKYVFVKVSKAERFLRTYFPVVLIVGITFGVFSNDLSNYRIFESTYQAIQNSENFYCDISPTRSETDFSYSASQRSALNYKDFATSFYCFSQCSAKLPEYDIPASCTVIGSAIAQGNASDYLSLSFIFSDSTIPYDNESAWISETFAQNLLTSYGSKAITEKDLLGKEIDLENGVRGKRKLKIANILSSDQKNQIFQRYTGNLAIINNYSLSELTPDYFSLSFSKETSFAGVENVMTLLLDSYPFSSFSLNEKTSSQKEIITVISNDELKQIKDFYVFRNTMLTLLSYLFVTMIMLIFSVSLCKKNPQLINSNFLKRTFVFSVLTLLSVLIIYIIFSSLYSPLSIRLFSSPSIIPIMIFSFTALMMPFWAATRRARHD